MAEASRHTVLRLVRNGFRAIISGEAGRRPPGRIRPPKEDVEAAIKELHAALDQRDAEAAVHGARQLMRAGREQFMRRQAKRAR
jgi:DNA-binding FadR family transcriptional regulator